MGKRVRVVGLPTCLTWLGRMQLVLNVQKLEEALMKHCQIFITNRVSNGRINYKESYVR